jgi:hypothetical protein
MNGDVPFDITAGQERRGRKYDCSSGESGLGVADSGRGVDNTENGKDKIPV